MSLRRAILHKAFSGQLVPQDPNDEPASVLLERIRAERARAQEQKEKTPKATNGASPVNRQGRRRTIKKPEATSASSNELTQRRGRVAKLAQRVSAGKR
jgi:hypothetical protein